MKRLTDKQIAERVLKLIDKFKSQEFVTKFSNFLDKHKRYSPFALSLHAFAWNWRNDLIIVCNKVIKMKD